MASKHPWLLLLCCCLIPVLNFPRALFSDRALFLRDINTVWSPQVDSVVRQVADGEPPFFDARRSFGQPLFADPRAEILYPPSWIHWIMPAETSYPLFCAFHLVIAALGAARLVRRLQPGAGMTAQMTAALAYGASGPLLSLVSHWHHLAAAAWMPWVIERCDTEPGARTPWLSLAPLVTLQILAGSPDYTFLTLILCGWRILTRRNQTIRTRALTLSCIGLGVLMSSVQTLPSLALARDAARESLPIGWARSPLHPALTVETILPVRIEAWPLTPGAGATLFGGMQVWMFSHYLGLSVWLLAGIGLLRSGVESRRFALGASVLGIVTAWGIQAEPLQRLVADLPLLSGLRFPTKYLAASSLGLAILAANGASMPSTPPTSPTRLGLVAFVAASLTAAVGLWSWGTQSGAAVPSGVWMRALAPVGLVGLSLLALRLNPRLGLVPLIVGADLLGSQTHLNPTSSSTIFRARPPLSAILPKGSRLYVSDYSMSLPSAKVRGPGGSPYRPKLVPLGASLAESVALAATWYLHPPIAGRFGYAGSFDLDILDFYRPPLKKMIAEFVTSRDPTLILDWLRRGSVDYVVTMDAEELWRGLTPVTEERGLFEDTVRIYRVPGRWPRVRYETPQGDLDREAGSPSVIEMSDGRLVVQTSAPMPTRLVVATSNERGWRATLNGVRAKIEETGMAFISIALPAGAHRVELVYRPPFLDLGLTITLLSLGILVRLSWRSGGGRG